MNRRTPDPAGLAAQLARAVARGWLVGLLAAAIVKRSGEAGHE